MENLDRYIDEIPISEHGVTLHPTARAYLRELLRRLDSLRTTAEISAYVAATHAIEIGWQETTDDNAARAQLLLLATDAILSAAAIVAAYKFEDVIVLPWDVAAVVQTEHNSLQISDDVEDRPMPVSLLINKHRYIHYLTEEQLAAVCLFGLAANIDFAPVIADVPFDPAYFVTSPRYQRTSNAYSIRIGDRRYTFPSPEFLRVFVSAASWNGKRDSDYWSELTHNGEAMQLQTAVF